MCAYSYIPRQKYKKIAFVQCLIKYSAFLYLVHEDLSVEKFNIFYSPKNVHVFSWAILILAGKLCILQCMQWVHSLS